MATRLTEDNCLIRKAPSTAFAQKLGKVMKIPEAEVPVRSLYVKEESPRPVMGVENGSMISTFPSPQDDFEDYFEPDSPLPEPPSLQPPQWSLDSYDRDGEMAIDEDVSETEPIFC